MQTKIILEWLECLKVCTNQYLDVREICFKKSNSLAKIEMHYFFKKMSFNLCLAICLYHGELETVV